MSVDKLRRAVMLTGLAAAGTAFLPARKHEEAGRGPLSRFRVGLVFDVGGRGDKSFNDAAYAGLEAAQKELGIQFTTLETSEGSDRVTPGFRRSTRRPGSRFRASGRSSAATING